MPYQKSFCIETIVALADLLSPKLKTNTLIYRSTRTRSCAQVQVAVAVARFTRFLFSSQVDTQL